MYYATEIIQKRKKTNDVMRILAEVRYKIN